jgi:hypothetical protein
MDTRFIEELPMALELFQEGSRARRSTQIMVFIEQAKQRARYRDRRPMLIQPFAVGICSRRACDVPFRGASALDAQCRSVHLLRISQFSSPTSLQEP